MNMPAVGWRFVPSDEELIKAHLIQKVRGFPLLWNGIVEKELYGVHASPPWEMFNDIDDDNSPPSVYCHTETNKERTATRKTVYVFTKLKAASPNSKKRRVSRGAGGGTWSGQTGPTYIKDSVTGDIIGLTKQLTFKHEGVDEQVVGHWIMHEYSLTAGWGSEFVLCKITRCTNHPAPAPAEEEEEEDEDEDEEEIEVEELMEPDSKKQKTVVSDDEDPNLVLTAEDIEKLWMNSDDHDFAIESEKILEHSDDHQVLEVQENDFAKMLGHSDDHGVEVEENYFAKELEKTMLGHSDDHRVEVEENYFAKELEKTMLEHSDDHHGVEVEEDYFAKELEKTMLGHSDDHGVEVEEDYFAKELEKTMLGHSDDHGVELQQGFAEELEKMLEHSSDDHPMEVREDFADELEKMLEHNSDDHQVAEDCRNESAETLPPLSATGNCTMEDDIDLVFEQLDSDYMLPQSLDHYFDQGLL